MDFSRCQPPCSRLIASDDQRGKCIRFVGLAHAQDAIFGISNCKYCKNFTLKTLRTRLAVFDREAAVLPRRATPEAFSFRKAAAWSLDAELEAIESEQISLSLPPSPGHHRANYLVQFLPAVLHPAGGNGKPFPSGWRIFYILRPPTLRNSEPRHSMWRTRRRSLLRPIDLWTFWRAPLRSWA